VNGLTFGTTTTGTVGPVANITGIITSASPATVSNNTVGSATPAYGLISSGSHTSTSVNVVTGFSVGNGSTYIQLADNTVNNLSNQFSSSGARVCGIVFTSSVIGNILRNTVQNLSTNAINTSTLTSASAVGMQFNSSSRPLLVSQNTITNLRNTNTGAFASQVIGMYFAVTTTTAQANDLIFQRNFIHGLNNLSSSTSASLVGMYLNSGGGLYRNNIVRVGLDATGASTTTGMGISGIWKASGSACNLFYNTVYVGGSVTGTTTSLSYALNRNINVSTDSIFNNVFVNMRTGGDATPTNFRHYAVGSVTALPNMNHNVYFAAGSNATFFRNQTSAIDYTTIAALRTALGNEMQGAFANPNFRAADAATPDLRVQSPTPVERAGRIPDLGNGDAVFLNNAALTDFEGDIRSANTPADAGADAGGYTPVDQTPPVIAYTPLYSPSPNTDARSLTALIADGNGVPTTGVGLPVLYWKRGAMGTFNAAQASFAGGAQYSFSFGAGVSVGDTVFYYVAAQDNASNTAVFPVTGSAGLTANPPAATTQPTQTLLSSYRVGGGLCGTITVPSAQYPTLRTVFDSLNISTLTCDLTINLASSITEITTCQLNPVNYGAGGPYRITVQPASGATVTITGNVSGPLVRLNG
ncbi:MAG: hypothetical protein ACKOAG_01510, partial [Candidatus Kapaibacterium sp.]